MWRPAQSVRGGADGIFLIPAYQTDAADATVNETLARVRAEFGRVDVRLEEEKVRAQVGHLPERDHDARKPERLAE